MKVAEHRRAVPIQFAGQALLPPWVGDFPSFRRWTRSAEYPDVGSISFCGDRIWVDVSMETYVHNQLKGKIATRLSVLAEDENLGEYVYDRMRLLHPDTLLSTEPDGMFFLHETRQSGKVQLSEGADSLEVIGSPDMVLEVISASSVKKDTEMLMELYWESGIAEYWLVDSRERIPTLEIYRRGADKYVAVRKQGGWLKSPVYSKSFRLTTTTENDPVVTHRLEMR